MDMDTDSDTDADTDTGHNNCEKMSLWTRQGHEKNINISIYFILLS